MKRTLSLAVLAPALAMIATPASAQPGPLARIINTAFHRCMWSAAPFYSALGKIRDCEPAIRGLESLRANASPEPSDLALIQFDLVIAHRIIGGAHALNGQSAEACIQYEKAWAEAARLDPPAHHPDAASMRLTRDDAAKSARKCRLDHPAPEGAPALPPDLPPG